MDNIALGTHGKPAYFGEIKPWHSDDKQATIFDASGRPTSSAAALDGAGANIDVEKKALHEIIPDLPKSKISVLFRKDTRHALGTCKGRYQVLQNRDAFKPLDILISSGVAEIITCGMLGHGGRAWIEARLKLPEHIQQNLGKVLPFVTVINDHSLALRAIAQFCATIIVCWNTVMCALGEFFSGKAIGVAVRHVGKSAQDLSSRFETRAVKMWTDGLKQYGLMALQFQLMRQTPMTDAEFGKVVLDNILGLPEETPDSKRGKTALSKLEDRRSHLTDLFAGKAIGLGTDIGQDAPSTAYAAHMAITESIQHEDMMWRVNKGTDRALDVKFGRLATLQETATRSLVEFCIERTDKTTLTERITEMMNDKSQDANLLDSVIAQA